MRNMIGDVVIKKNKKKEKKTMEKKMENEGIKTQIFSFILK